MLLFPLLSRLIPDVLAVSMRANPLHLTAAEISTKKAMAQASLSHKDIHFFELHDAYSIMACLSLEV
jgi:acetyl-CoA C-acetyltransferase